MTQISSQQQEPHASADVSLLVCTRNNALRLRRTLQSIGKLDTGDAVLREVLVVDNGSTDATAEVVEKAARENPLVRYVSEPTAGHNRAYNTGVAASSGALVLFTDDDVRPPVDWVLRMQSKMLSGEYDALAGGVGVCDRYAHAIQAMGLWTAREWFAITKDLAPGEAGITVGANMMFRRPVLDKAGPFRLDLGPGSIGDCGDTEYFIRLERLGCKIGFAYDVKLEHRFDLQRMRWDKLKKAAVRRGKSRGYMQWRVFGETIEAPTWGQWFLHDLPRMMILPPLQLVWPGASARRAYLISRRAAVAENQAEQAKGPPQPLAEQAGPS